MIRRTRLSECVIGVVGLTCVALFPLTSNAEDPTHVWTRTFGGAGTDVGNGIASARAASIVTVGRFEGTVDFDPGAGETQRTSNGRSDAFASSLDIDGGFEWAVTIGGSSGEEPLAVATDSDRNVFVAGWYAGTVDFDPSEGEDLRVGFGGRDIYVTAYDRDGGYLWTYAVGGTGFDGAQAVAADQAGNVYVSGSFERTVDFDPGEGEDIHAFRGGSDVFVTKILADGTYAWTRTFGGVGGEIAEAIAVGIDGGVFVTGSFDETVDFDPGESIDERTSNGNGDIFVTHLLADGSYGWTEAIGGTANESALSIAVGPAGHVVISGRFESAMDFDPGDGEDRHRGGNRGHMFVSRWNPDRSYGWTRTLGPRTDAGIWGLGVDTDRLGNVLVGGWFGGETDFDPGPDEDLRFGFGSHDGFLVLLDEDGLYEGAYIFGGDSADDVRDVVVDDDGYAVITGFFGGSVDFDPAGAGDVHESNGGFDVFVTRLRYGTTDAPGGCCFGPDCQVLTSEECADQGGAFFGAGSTCEDAECDALYGACCDGVACAFTTEDQCADSEGRFLGAGSSCSQNPCGPGPSLGWSTFRNDPQRTGRSDAVVVDAPVLRWRVFTGSSPGTRFIPSFGPDGTIYAIGENLVAVSPDGEVKWTADTGPNIGPPSVREDGDLWVGGTKYSHEDGQPLCARGSAQGTPGAIDETGQTLAAIFGSDMIVRQLDPDCTLAWEYNGGPGTPWPLAVDHNGGVHVSESFEFAKLDPADGSVVWSNIGEGRIGPAAIGSDGTSYRTFEPSALLATDSDGVEAWRLEWDQWEVRVERLTPAIGADDSIYVVGEIRGQGYPTLIKVSPSGEEVWRFVEPVDGRGRTAVIDGSGIVIFTTSSGLIGVESVDGTERWRISAGEEGSIGVPAISEDGTLYAMTSGGFLAAFGAPVQTCPGPIGTTPPYKYRRIAAEREQINEYRINEIEAFEVATNGLLTFQADVVNFNRSAAFIERSDGSFLSIGPGSQYGGFEIDEAWLPRRDEQGNVYVPAALLNIGHGVFKNGELALSTGTPPRSEYAPIVVHEMEDVLFDIDAGGGIYMMGRVEEADPRSVLVFSIDRQRVASIHEEGEVLEPIRFGTDQDHRMRNQVTATGRVVAFDEDEGVVRDCELIVGRGEVIDGHRLSAFKSGQINERGDVYFWASDFDGNGGIFSEDRRLVGDGDRIGDHIIAQIDRFEVNNRGSIAYSALLSSGQRAIFVDGESVAVEGEEVAGQVVDEVMTHLLRYNEAGQVGFVVRSSDRYRFYVATPGGEFEYRQIMATDDELDGMDAIAGFDAIMMGEAGLVAADLTLHEVLRVAPIRVDTVVVGDHFSRTNTGRFTVLARKTPWSALRVALVNSGSESIDFLVGIGDTVDGFEIVSIRSGEREERLVSDSGEVVLGCRDRFGSSAVLTQNAVVARTGDFVDGHRLNSLFLPTITASGDVFFVATYDSPGTGSAVFSPTQRLIGTGDVLDPGTIAEVRNASVNDAGEVAVAVWLEDGRDALFVDGQSIAVELETIIDGELLFQLGNRFVRLNESGQVAFQGTVTDRASAIYVATPTLDPKTPYVYRRVAELQQVINGVRLHAFTEFRLSDAGLVSIYAQRGGSNPSKVFRETAEGVFEVMVEGDELDGVTIQILSGAPQVDSAGRAYQQAAVSGVGMVCFVDGSLVLQSSDFARKPGMVVETAEGQFNGIDTGRRIGDFEIDLDLARGFAPRLDANSNAYVYTGVVGVGPTLFRNDQPLVQVDVEGATAPVLLEDWGSTAEIFSVAARQYILVYGKRAEDTRSGLLLIDAVAGTSQRVFHDDCLDGWVLEFVDSAPGDERHAGASDRTFAVQGDDRTAIVRDDRTYVRDGDTVGGRILNGFSLPQIVGPDVVFVGEFDGGNGLFTAGAAMFATGDEVGGYTLDRVFAHSSVPGVSAFTASLDDARLAVFRNGAALAVPGDTMINGSLVELVDVTVVRQNEANQVALLAATVGQPLAAFVASGPDEAITYREAAKVGDQIAGREVLSIDDLRMDEQGLISFVSRGDAASTTMFREVAEGQFDTFVQGDSIADVTVDFTRGEPFAPRVTPSGTEVLLLPVRPIGMMLFANRTPLAHQPFDPSSDGVVYIGDLARKEYVDHDEQGRFLVFGSVVRGQPPAILLIDPDLETATPLITQGAFIDGFQADRLDPAIADGYGDDDFLVTRATDNGQGSGILSRDEVLARRGDVIDGITIENPFDPRRTADRTAYFIAEGVVFRRTPDARLEIARGPETVQTLAQSYISRYAVNESHQIGYISPLVASGTNAIFVDDRLVAASGVTLMFDAPVAFIEDSTATVVSINDDGCVAFVGRVEGDPLTLLVACPLAPFDGNGDERVDLVDYDRFWECLSGPDDFMSAGCEVFDIDDNCHVDLRDAAMFQVSFDP